MKMDEYQDLASRTMSDYANDNFATAVYSMGLAGEAGEVVDYLKKVVGHGHPLDKDILSKELGDVLWYVAALCAHNGLSMSEVAQGNVDKLKVRYPDGFSSERSISRTDEVGAQSIAPVC